LGFRSYSKQPREIGLHRLGRQVASLRLLLVLVAARWTLRSALASLILVSLGEQAACTARNGTSQHLGRRLCETCRARHHLGSSIDRCATCISDRTGTRCYSFLQFASPSPQRTSGRFQGVGQNIATERCAHECFESSRPAFTGRHRLPGSALRRAAFLGCSTRPCRRGRRLSGCTCLGRGTLSRFSAPACFGCRGSWISGHDEHSSICSGPLIVRESGMFRSQNAVLVQGT
jgi:hypothetical protein